jgi:ABC-type methionine transport system ATPase subunit
MTLVMVTHEMEFVREVADRVLYLSQGKIVQDCTTEHYFSAARTKTSSSSLLKPVLDRSLLASAPLLAAGL